MRTLILTAAIICASASGDASADARTERMEAAQQALLAWFECIECHDGELDAVLAYRGLVEDALIQTLMRGPSPARRAQIADQLRTNHERPPQRIPEDLYVEQFLASVGIGYQMRAATALGRLSTPTARAALERVAQGTGYAAPVKDAALRALGRR